MSMSLVSKRKEGGFQRKKITNKQEEITMKFKYTFVTIIIILLVLNWKVIIIGTVADVNVPLMTTLFLCLDVLTR